MGPLDSLESELDSLQGAALIYGDEPMKGNHLSLIYVRDVMCSGFCHSEELGIAWRKVHCWLCYRGRGCDLVVEGVVALVLTNVH
jgi:hypothetical protein